MKAMKTRKIQPGFFRNPRLARLGTDAQVLFAGLWCIADKCGLVVDDPCIIKSDIFPFTDVDVDSLLTKLHHHGFIIRYLSESYNVIGIPKFLNHQSPHHAERPSILPQWDEKTCKLKTIEDEEITRNYANSSENQRNGKHARAYTDNINNINTSYNNTSYNNTSYNNNKNTDVLSLSQKRERQVVEAKSDKKPLNPTVSATRLPCNWSPSFLEKNFLKTQRPDLDPEKTIANFRDYWTSLAGPKAMKTDWSAAFRYWVRNERQVVESQKEKERKWVEQIFSHRKRKQPINNEGFIDVEES